ncbi:hypothetical protein Lalb_Chr09g0332601 [Lupinus albus]|uniref:Uncharacterized protein n=1 Tax=Lupinus albus TaxID=3870 RepID=A0A6A4Q0S7_LUPAL|nr:hypothetical protein Lalb_Chr09g0332601 [Lupinus albus]
MVIRKWRLPTLLICHPCIFTLTKKYIDFGDHNNKAKGAKRINTCFSTLQ